jgi:uncharacterized protein YukE
MAHSYDLGSQTLVNLGRQTEASSGELVGLVTRLVEVAGPLQGKFSGSAKASFDRFKGEVDRVTADLSSALAGLGVAVGGQAQAFASGDEQMSSAMVSGMAAAPFDSARFGGM